MPSAGPSNGDACFAIRLAHLDALTFVVLLLAARDPDFDLCPIVLEVALGRDQRHAVAFGEPTNTVDLLPVQEELSWSIVGVAKGCVFHLGDAHALDPGLPSPVDVDPGIAEIRRVLSERTRFAPDEREPGFEGFADLVIEVCPTVFRNQAVAFNLLAASTRHLRIRVLLPFRAPGPKREKRAPAISARTPVSGLLCFAFLMASRPPFSSSPYPGVGYWGSLSPSRARPRTLGDRVAGVVYGFSWVCVFAAAAFGVLFALYRNDVLLSLAQDAGVEERYLRLEAFFFGSPGWGTPRSVHSPGGVELLGPSPITERELERAAAQRVAPAPPSGQAGVSVPARMPESEPAGDALEPQPTSEGVAIVSLDALPVQSTASVGRSSPGTSVPPRTVLPARSVPSPGSISKPIASSSRAVKAEPTPVAAPKAAPEPAKKAVSAPAANDDPLKAAMRSAVLKESGQGP